MRSDARTSSIVVVLVHPDIHLELARQRQSELIACAARTASARIEPGDPEPSSTFRELARRVDGAVDVSLLWRPRDNRLAVIVSDSRSGDRLVLDVAHAEALEVFFHPFAHLDPAAAA